MAQISTLSKIHNVINKCLYELQADINMGVTCENRHSKMIHRIKKKQTTKNNTGLKCDIK